MKVVYLTDEKIPYENAQEHFSNVNLWALENCHSYRSYHVQDVSDVSYVYDHVAAYTFGDVKDAMIFTLRWL